MVQLVFLGTFSTKMITALSYVLEVIPSCGSSLFKRLLPPGVEDKPLHDSGKLPHGSSEATYCKTLCCFILTVSLNGLYQVRKQGRWGWSYKSGTIILFQCSSHRAVYRPSQESVTFTSSRLMMSREVIICLDILNLQNMAMDGLGCEMMLSDSLQQQVVQFSIEMSLCLMKEMLLNLLGSYENRANIYV